MPEANACRLLHSQRRVGILAGRNFFNVAHGGMPALIAPPLRRNRRRCREAVSGVSRPAAAAAVMSPAAYRAQHLRVMVQ